MALTVVFAIATVLLAHLIIAPSVASIIVDVSPFATNGALVLADAQDVDRTPSASRSSVTPRSSSPWGRCLPDWCSSSSPLL